MIWNVISNTMTLALMSSALALETRPSCPQLLYKTSVDVSEPVGTVVAIRGMENQGDFPDREPGLYYLIKTYGAGSLPYLSLVRGSYMRTRGDTDFVSVWGADLERVFDAYSSAGFSSDRMAWIRRQEKLLPEDRIIRYRQSNQPGDGRDSAVSLRLFDGSMINGTSSELPLERHLQRDVPERRHASQTAVLEIGRTAVFHHTAQPSRLLKEVATYVSSQYLSKNLPVEIYVHTDVSRTRVFRRRGFRIVWSPEDLGIPDETVLKISGADLVDRNGSWFANWVRESAGSKFQWEDSFEGPFPFRVYDHHGMFLPPQVPPVPLRGPLIDPTRFYRRVFWGTVDPPVSGVFRDAPQVPEYFNQIPQNRWGQRWFKSFPLSF